MPPLQRTGVVVAGLACALAAVPLANASFIVTRNASRISLHVDGTRAIVDFRAQGRSVHGVFWGAVDARQPNPHVRQVSFRHVYGAGALSRGSCRPYTGPSLPLLVAACTAPDGSYWALQKWQRLVPNYGGASGVWELHLSHWTGPLPVLQVWQDWTYGRYAHLFGKLTYRGRGVYGFHSTSVGNPLDSYGRNLYLDTFDSAYGAGWRRENSFLTHGPGGTFCYGFFAHGSHPPGAGSEYRLTVAGPGVTPVVSWSAPSPGPYDPAADRQLNSVERSLGDPKCRHA